MSLNYIKSYKYHFDVWDTLQPLCNVMRGKKELAAIPSTHSPLSCSKVLQRSRSCLQGVVVVTAGEKREVEPHHLWLVQQLQPFNKKSREYMTINYVMFLSVLLIISNQISLYKCKYVNIVPQCR